MLYISKNKFQSDLTVFSQLVNLQTMMIGFNQFTGSLAPLVNLTKLKELLIANTQIDSGLEYLPDSIERFDYRWNKLATELEDYEKPWYDYGSCFPLRK